jgi:protein-disulfide isomerase
MKRNFLRIGATLALILALATPACADDSSTKPRQAATPQDLKAQVEKILRENPQIILDVLREQKIQVLEIAEQGARARQEQERERQFQAGLQNPRQPAIDPSRPILGNAKAPVTIVEYSDFLCPYCGRASDSVKEVMRRHPDTYRLVFKHFPLHDFSRQLALTFEAIALQSPAKAWLFADFAFNRQEQLNRDKDKALEPILDELGVDKARLKEDMKRPALGARIDQDTEEARRFEFKGTPSFLLNGAPLFGAVSPEEFERVTKLIEEPGPAGQSASQPKAP